MSDSLEEVAHWKLRIKEDALKGLMIGVRNTAKAFLEDKTVVEVKRIDIEADSHRIDSTIDIGIYVKKKVGEVYPANLVGMIAHDINNRFGALVYQEYRREDFTSSP
ncbi:MAG: hypothetical protein ABSG05_00530 [Candidatus Pacearchaeota archaeon]|jgi:hypothetical protein